jgi:hypothetical protein
LCEPNFVSRDTAKHPSVVYKSCSYRGDAAFAWGKGKAVDSYSVYKVLRPSARNGARFKVYVEWSSRKDDALRRAQEIRDRACGEVEAVEVVDYGSGGEVIYRAECGSVLAS